MVLAWLVNDLLPSYLKSVPIPYGFSDLKFFTLGEWVHFTAFMGIATYAGFAVAQVRP
jgi:hypothetical protein